MSSERVKTIPSIPLAPPGLPIDYIDPIAAFLYPRREGREKRVHSSFMPVVRYGLKYGETRMGAHRLMAPD